MKKLVWISVLSVFLWACKGSSGSASSSSTMGAPSQNMPQGSQGNVSDQNTENSNLNQQDAGNKTTAPQKSVGGVQNNAIKNQHPAAK